MVPKDLKGLKKGFIKDQGVLQMVKVVLKSIVELLFLRYTFPLILFLCFADTNSASCC